MIHTIFFRKSFEELLCCHLIPQILHLFLFYQNDNTHFLLCLQQPRVSFGHFNGVVRPYFSGKFDGLHNNFFFVKQR